MHIPFGVTRINQIGDQTISVILKKMLFQKYNITIDKIKSTVVRFPYDAEILNSHFYYWLPGTGYKRSFLWITKISDLNMCILINLDSKKIFQVSMRLNDEIFNKEFILSGEIIHTDSTNYFMSEDIISLYDYNTDVEEDISKMNYLQRIKIIDELIKEYFIEDMIYNDINVKLKTPINILGDIEKFSEIVKKVIIYIKILDLFQIKYLIQIMIYYIQML